MSVNHHESMDQIDSELTADATTQSSDTDPPVPPLNQVTHEDFTAMNLEIVNNTAKENDGKTPVKYFESPQITYPGDKPELFYQGDEQTTKEFEENVMKTYFGQGDENDDANGQENAKNNTTGEQNDSTDATTTTKKTRAKKGTQKRPKTDKDPNASTTRKKSKKTEKTAEEEAEDLRDILDKLNDKEADNFIVPPMTYANCYEKVPALLHLSKENIRATDGRHYARMDRNQTCRWDQHNFCLRRFIINKKPICGLHGQKFCYYCKMMSPQARLHRIKRAQRYLKNPNLINKKSTWIRLNEKIRHNTDAQKLCKERGVMFEYAEHDMIDSRIRLPPENIIALEVGTQTKISLFLRGPDPKDESKTIDFKQLPGPESQQRIWNTNYHCERFITKEFAELYNDRLKWSDKIDPGKFYISKEMKLALMLFQELKARQREIEDTQGYVDEDDVQDKFIDEKTNTDLIAYYTYEYKTTHDDHVPGRNYLCNDYPPIHILEHTIDGNYFDATQFTAQEKYDYHRFWMEEYAKEPEVIQRDTAVFKELLPEETQRGAWLDDPNDTLKRLKRKSEETEGDVKPIMKTEDIKTEDIKIETDNDAAKPSTSTDAATPSDSVHPHVSLPILPTANATDQARPITPQRKQDIFAKSTVQLLEYAQVLAAKLTPTSVLKPIKITDDDENNNNTSVISDVDHVQIPMYLHWKYDERNAEILPDILRFNSGLTGLKLSESKHMDSDPEKTRKFRKQAGIDLQKNFIQTIDTRLGIIRQHLAKIPNRNWQKADSHAPSSVNISPYLIENATLPVMTYELSSYNDGYADASTTPDDEVRLVAKDVFVWEQYAKLLVNISNMAAAITKAVSASLTKKEPTETAEQLLERHDDVMDDLRQAVCELVTDIVATRRLRSMTSIDRMSKDTILALATSALSREQWLYTDENTGTFYALPFLSFESMDCTC